MNSTHKVAGSTPAEGAKECKHDFQFTGLVLDTVTQQEEWTCTKCPAYEMRDRSETPEGSAQ